MKKTTVTALLCALIATPVLAQSQSGRYWYGALDFGTLTMRNTDFPNPGSMTLSAGYRLNRNLAMEGGLTLVGDSTLSDAFGTQTARQSDLRFVAMGIMPLSPAMDLFAKGGLGLHSVKINGTGAYAGTTNPYTTTNIIYGFGAQFNVSPTFGLRLQYENLGTAKASASDPGADISRISFGGVGRF